MRVSYRVEISARQTDGYAPEPLAMRALSVELDSADPVAAGNAIGERVGGAIAALARDVQSVCASRERDAAAKASAR